MHKLTFSDSADILPRDPSGNPVAYVCADGGMLCAGCVRENLSLVNGADSDTIDGRQWAVIGALRPSPSAQCDNCYRRISD